jgi:SAM-dependent methyltransferase
LRYIASELNFDIRRGAALDFGCGVGRLTQALCRHFERAVGVDIAPSMIRLANQFNRFGDRCRYCLNEANDLRLFADDSFDFIYSNLVLQHMQPDYSKNYIKEFVRVLAPGGIAFFQLPGLPGERDYSHMDLPASAFRARIEPLNAPDSLEADARWILRVRVKNVGDGTWPRWPDNQGRRLVTLGDRWLDSVGNFVEDGRTSLPRDLGPGEEVEVPLEVAAPGKPGRYILELDMVQEDVAWFQDRGSETARATVLVTGSAHRPSASRGAEVDPGRSCAAGEQFSPVMEMYGVDQVVVTQLIKDQGGNIISIYDYIDNDWLLYYHHHYYIIKYNALR